MSTTSDGFQIGSHGGSPSGMTEEGNGWIPAVRRGAAGALRLPLGDTDPIGSHGGSPSGMTEEGKRRRQGAKQLTLLDSPAPKKGGKNE